MQFKFRRIFFSEGPILLHNGIQETLHMRHKMSYSVNLS